MKIYGIPGLGADERVYQELNKFLPQEIIPLKWLAPVKKESLTDYVQRFKSQIDEQDEFVLIGVSFGGMIASELCKYLKPTKAILISSCAIKFELPWSIKLLPSFILKAIPDFMLKPPFWLSKKFFGIKGNENKELLKQIIEDTDVEFLRWAMIQIINWKNEVIPDNLYKVHGKSDLILPFPKNQDVFAVDGGHFVIVEKARKIAKQIELILELPSFT